MNRILQLIIVMMVVGYTSKAETITVTDDWIKEGETKTMTADNIYVLDRFVFVEDGAELWIEPGTVIQGKTGQESNASALIIAQGGKIYANGTPDKPIIFTFEGDDPYDYFDYPMQESGLWGGLIVLGNAPTNNQDGTRNIEGIPENNSKGQYGGNDPMDNSGVIRYVSIRHGGTDIGEGNEINGLTMGAVGAGTTIEYVEVLYNKDDGFEWFGGTVNTRYLVSAFNGDDAFDYDEGFTGKGQFWFSIQATDRGNMGGEHDGGNKPDDSEPYARPTISNATYIGSGPNSGNPKSSGLLLRDNAGGKYYNSIFTEFTSWGLNIEDLESGEDSENRLNTGDLALKNNIWWNINSKENPSLTDIAPDVPDAEKDGKVIKGYSLQSTRDYLSNSDNNNWIVDPGLNQIDRGQNGLLNPTPSPNSAAVTNETYKLNDNFIQDVDYIGAFAPGDMWFARWSGLYHLQVARQIGANTVAVTDDWIKEGEKKWFTNDNIYVLDRFVFVEDGAELWIEPGTIIQGKPGQESNASALIIAQGGKIYAEGTAAQPIIFTFEGDDPYDNFDYPMQESGLWGGLLVLGKGPTNNPDGTRNIEGIPENNPKGQYGGNDPMDNSGIIKYVSIRHGGTDIGEGNEINGLTMGAVGSATTIEFVEVIYNKDDGFEWFGGNVNTRYLVSAFNGDDSFDYDEGFNGMGQFWFSIQATDRGNMAGEHDGGNKPDDSAPFAIPQISNVTYIGSGINSPNAKSMGLIFRDNAGGKYYNGIMTEQTSEGLNIEDLENGQDSKSRMDNGDLHLQNFLWWGISGEEMPSLTEIAPDVADSEKDGKVIKGYSLQPARDYLGNADNGNRIEDPALYSIDRTQQSWGLDPRPSENGPAWSGVKTLPSNGFHRQTEYVGAFGGTNWAVDWTALNTFNIMSTNAAANPTKFGPTLSVNWNSSTNINVVDNKIKVYPNPVATNTTIEFRLDKSTNVDMKVYDFSGLLIESLVNKYMTFGNYGITWTPENVPTGTYIVRLETDYGVYTQKMIVK
ncbi:MAG: T9SS type A sorting domain-containing protein [Chlorobiota bacterium]